MRAMTPLHQAFSSPVRVVYGPGAIENLPDLLADLGAKRPFVVTDPGIAAAGLLDAVKSAIQGAATLAGVADDVPPDSDLAVVQRIARLCRDSRSDSVVAVGGGSVMDTAKVANLLFSRQTHDPLPFLGNGAITGRLQPMIAIPTTAGTGAEATQVAVIMDREARTKRYFLSSALVFDAAVLDPRMTVGLPPALTAATAMDALAHAVEGYTCLGKNPLSDAHAIRAIRLIMEGLPSVMKTPADLKARTQLAVGAHLAGVAFSNSMVGVAHALGHAVGSVCHVPHGQAVAIFLPYALELNRTQIEASTGELLLPLAGEAVFSRTPSHRRSEEVICHIRALMTQLHQWTGGRFARFLGEIRGADGGPILFPDHFDAIVSLALDDAAMIYNPTAADAADLGRILDHAMDGRPMPTRP